MPSVRVTLDLPPSANHMYKRAYRSMTGGGVYLGQALTDEARAWGAAAEVTVWLAAVEALGHRPQTDQASDWPTRADRLAVSIRWRLRYDRFDLDNPVKLCLDALARGLRTDDRLVHRLRLTKLVEAGMPEGADLHVRWGGGVRWPSEYPRSSASGRASGPKPSSSAGCGDSSPSTLSGGASIPAPGLARPPPTTGPRSPPVATLAPSSSPRGCSPATGPS